MVLVVLVMAVTMVRGSIPTTKQQPTDHIIPPPPRSVLLSQAVSRAICRGAGKKKEAPPHDPLQGYIMQDHACTRGKQPVIHNAMWNALRRAFTLLAHWTVAARRLGCLLKIIPCWGRTGNQWRQGGWGFK